MSPQTVDATCLVVAAALPIPLILRWNWRGVVCGTLVVWGSLVAAGALLSALDHSRQGGVLDGIWLLFGWIGGLLYCMPIYAMKRIIMRLWRSPTPSGKAASHQPRPNGPKICD